MWRELRSVFERIQSDEGVRCVLMRGADGHFCAGGDISEYPAFRFDSTSLLHFHESDVWGGLQAMLDCDVPILALIEGNCIGAGIEMACCCDIRVAGVSAQFGAPIARLGFPMAPREAKLVAREVGLATTREMLLSAAVLDASRMLACGFLNQIYDDHDVPMQALDWALRVTSLAPQAARLNKRTLRNLLESERVNTPNAAASILENSAYNYASSAEHREGVNAFVQKRKPIF
jgi:enoyl-CoA hydratase/carnithine racemase